jgi:Cu/Ag efflux protein CusF
MMTLLRRLAGLGAAMAVIAATGACSGTLGNVLGSVLGGGGQAQSNQLSGTVRGINTNNQQITIQQPNGQSIAVLYDHQTRVVYQNQNYSVSSLEYGDQVTASIRQSQNGAYYTDYVQVDQSVSSGASSGGAGNVQSFQGTVRQIDSRNGLFTVQVGNGIITVALPYNPRSTDVNRFQNLRSGDNVRFYGVFVNNSRVELRQFY